MRPRRALILCHSRSGASARLAREAARLLRAEGWEASHHPLLPRRSLPYPLWLALSFLPRLRVPLKPLPASPADFDALIFAFPKWTFACPPAEALLRGAAGHPPTVLLVACGGWDQERYLADFKARWEKRGGRVAGAATARRDEIAGGKAAARVEDALRPLLRP